MTRCSFCNEEIPEGRKKIYATKTGQVSYFCGSKCQRNMKIRKPFKVKWITKKQESKKAKKVDTK